MKKLKSKQICKFDCFFYFKKKFLENASYIQLPYGFVKNNKQIQFNLPSDFEESQYYKEVPFITNESPSVKNNLLNLLRNRENLKKWLLATSDYGNEI